MGTQAVFQKKDLLSAGMSIKTKFVKHGDDMKEEHWHTYGEALNDYEESHLDTGISACHPYTYSNAFDEEVVIDWKQGGHIRTTLEPLIGHFWHRVI
jgi:hypothetical protein